MYLSKLYINFLKIIFKVKEDGIIIKCIQINNMNKNLYNNKKNFSML